MQIKCILTDLEYEIDLNEKDIDKLEIVSDMLYKKYKIQNAKIIQHNGFYYLFVDQNVNKLKYTEKCIVDEIVDNIISNSDVEKKDMDFIIHNYDKIFKSIYLIDK
ncbi:hypothetical protein EHP00_158 [Ecytonucleospora hepatopenaei]|uniref:Uncharacterized protein n=1 Tax=Ecytonucleospora hepatopenaei TaxID=646526 RepID=A0A1W0E6D3_9MICR|nr:hypothetical protein EHP00_158 [Ecytonucleospora hepatopenaei]